MQHEVRSLPETMDLYEEFLGLIDVLDGLGQMKRLSGRTQDKADLEGLGLEKGDAEGSKTNS